MRGPNSPRPLRAASSSLFAFVLPSIVLTIVLFASPASTRSVIIHGEIGNTDNGVIVEKLKIPKSHETPGIQEIDFPESDGISKRDNVGKDVIADEKLSLVTEIGTPIEQQVVIGKSSIDSELEGTKRIEESVKNKEDEGIRRFDAIVLNEDAVEKNSGAEEKKQGQSSEIGKTVIKGIIVRDAPIDSSLVHVEPEIVPGVLELSGVKVHRKRSLNDPELTSVPVEAVVGEPSAPNENIEAGNDASEKIADSAKTRQVPVLIPVGSSHAKLKRAEKTPAVEVPVAQQEEHLADLLPAEETGVQVQVKTAETEIGRIIPELTQAHEKSVAQVGSEESVEEKEQIVVPELKSIIIHEDGVGVVDDKLEIAKEQVLSARKSLPIAEESEPDEVNEGRVERSEEEAMVDQEIPKLEQIVESVKIEEIPKPATDEELYSSSLSSVMPIQESLEDLKAQAISIQREIRDNTYLEKLREQSAMVLPGIPKFTEIQLLDSLKTISSSKKSTALPESSYLLEMDTSNLNENQLQILKCTEALLPKEQRQTFAENVMECIRGLDMFNCLRIFVWPVIANNLPESFVQNIPTLPIEINVSDLLSGNRQDQPKAESFRSVPSSHQQRLITPELVVSSILKDALNANPTKLVDILPSFIDPQNETLTKLLTPGQLEILKMAEKFLPESTRQEYSNRMFSCVRRFEYFSCVKYFAWPMVKQHYPVLPDFPDYQSWYPGVSLYPGYPILPYPNAEGIGELPEVVEADATRTRSPRPEKVIVQILENNLRQVPGYPVHSYQARQPAAVPVPITPDQMAIFYTAQQFIPVQLRDDYMAKTMACIREYDYLTCTRYSTWPTVRQWFPSLPDFPDFSSLIPTFALPELPDFSQYIPDLGSFIPNFPGIGGGTTTTTEKPSEAKPIPDQPPQEVNATIVTNQDLRLSAATSPIENRIIQILSNIRWFPLIRNAQPIASVTPESLEILKKLTYNQLRILGLAKNAIPPSVRADLDSRFVGCLQGGSEFITCTKNVIWPTLQLYVKNMPIFPEDNPNPSMQKNSEETYSTPAIKPGVYQPIAGNSAGPQPIFLENPGDIAGRSPIGGQILAESEETPISVAQLQPILQNLPSNQNPAASLRQGVSAKSNDPSIPVISVTDTRFTPIFSDHPETVLLKILTTIQASSKYADNSYTTEKPGYIESLNDYLNADEKNVIRISENLLPDEIKPNFRERVKECVAKSDFIICSRDIVWPSLAQYYQRLPSFPNFYITDHGDRINVDDLKVAKSDLSGVAPISETNVKTGQHGDAMVTITDTRFVPIFSQHPEAVILTILRNVQASSPNLLAQPGAAKSATRTSEFAATFTDQQGNIIMVAENLLPESIREVFTKRMSECVKENSFLACTRDIAWPTIAQFIPRLPNFPNISALPDFAIEKPQQPALLPPQLESAKPSLAPGITLLTENLIPVTPLDIESRIESTLKQISSPTNSVEPKYSYLNPGDPAVASRLTDRQTNVIRLIEGMLPLNAKPIVVGKMVDCTRADYFPNCVKNYGWPLLRQYVPNIPDFPDIGSYFPQIPQEIPQLPQLPDYQLPQIPNPNFPGLGQFQGFGFPFRSAQDKLGQQGAGSLVEEAKRQRLTPSVDSSSTVDPGSRQSSGLPQSVVPELSAQTTSLLSEMSSDRRRKRRNVGEEPPANYQDISFDNVQPKLPPNTTESEFLKILVNITKKNEETTQRPEEYFVEALNSTMKDALTTEQLAILKIVEDISSQSAKGFMSQVFQCIRSLSFIRCMGIFVWPVITQNVPSLLGIPTLGSLNPFGRSVEGKESFEDIFGMTSKEFEEELLERKKNVEKILIGWYRGIVEEKYDNDYGFLRVQGYGDGEIGISFNDLKRKGRIAKIKDSKNMPSILTIISDIMEDVLDQRDSRPEKKDHGKRVRSLYDEDNYNRVSSDHDVQNNSERSNNDDQIISMFLDKIKVNSSSETGGSDGNNYLSIEDAYAAFELLFGTRLSEKMAEKLHELNKSHYRVLKDEKTLDYSKKIYKSFVKKTEERRTSTNVEGEQSEENGGVDSSEKKAIRSGLVLRLPKLDEEFVSRKMTSGLVELGRKMKMKMSQVVPGITFLVSFFIQMALAHARAAASVAGMMSNMALGSAIMSMLRQSFFGSMNDPKIKHVYDNAAIGPGITWPQHNYHG